MSSTNASPFIRKATPADKDALFEICLKTADAGEDGTALYGDPRLPGYIWAAAYGELEPDFTFVLETPAGVAGYVLATANTAAFARRLETEWWPRVRRETAGYVPKRPSDEAALAYIAEPQHHAAWLQTDYPAHMHINLLPKAQSAGWGRKLIDVELAALKAGGVRGVHLGVSPKNDRAKGFYEHLGFEDISRDGKVTYGLRFQP